MPSRRFLLALLSVGLSCATAAAQAQSFLAVDDVPDSDGPVTVEYTPDGARVLILHHQSIHIPCPSPNPCALSSGRPGTSRPGSGT